MNGRVVKIAQEWGSNIGMGWEDISSFVVNVYSDIQRVTIVEVATFKAFFVPAT